MNRCDLGRFCHQIFPVAPPLPTPSPVVLSSLPATETASYSALEGLYWVTLAYPLGSALRVSWKFLQPCTPEQGRPLPIYLLTLNGTTGPLTGACGANSGYELSKMNGAGT